MGLSDRDYTKDLYALLGIGRHVSPEELRYAYEQAMSAATRSGDMARAKTLLAAYEALSSQRRQKVFGRTFDGAPAPRPPGAKPATALPKPARTPRPKKWGMSLPIRILAFGVIVPLFLMAEVMNLLHPQSGSTPNAAGQPPVLLGGVQSPAVSATQAALFVDRMDGRSDVSCSPTGSQQGLAHFTCQASDGQTWTVSGSSPFTLSAVVVAMSVYMQSARMDAFVVVNSVSMCRRMFGSLPPSAGPQSVRLPLICGGEMSVIYLKPGDVAAYNRISSTAFRVTVTAGNGELVSYDSRTAKYSPRETLAVSPARGR